jgi:hypothetical protein
VPFGSRCILVILFELQKTHKKQGRSDHPSIHHIMNHHRSVAGMTMNPMQATTHTFVDPATTFPEEETEFLKYLAVEYDCALDINLNVNELVASETSSLAKQNLTLDLPELVPEPTPCASSQHSSSSSSSASMDDSEWTNNSAHDDSSSSAVQLSNADDDKLEHEPVCVVITPPKAVQIQHSRPTSTHLNPPFPPPVLTTAAAAAAAKKLPKRKKRERARSGAQKMQRRGQLTPKEKVYVHVTAKDVLMGRGGCSNHHVGNDTYRQHVISLQLHYKQVLRQDKTKCSEQVVQWVKDRGGRFLQKDTTTTTSTTTRRNDTTSTSSASGSASSSGQWYIVTDQMARSKVSQALREEYHRHSPGGGRRQTKKTSQATRRRPLK